MSAIGPYEWVRERGTGGQARKARGWPEARGNGPELWAVSIVTWIKITVRKGIK